MLEARYALKRSVLMVGGGGLMALANTFMYLFMPVHYPALWIVGGLLALLGLRGLNRSVILRVGPDGIEYRPWGLGTIPWSSFERFSLFSEGKYPMVVAHAVSPADLRHRLPPLARFGAFVNERMGKPPFYFNPMQLDVDADRLLSALTRHAGE